MGTAGGDPYAIISIALLIFNAIPVEIIVDLGIIIVLIGCSALLSGSESAFFSLKNKDLIDLQENGTVYGKTVCYLHERPKKLLATILIANTFVNIMVAIIATRVLDSIHFRDEVVRQLVDVVVVTFTLVLLGEVVPKVYAAHNNTKFAQFMSYPLLILSRVVYPLSVVLTSTTAAIEKRLKTTHEASLEEIKHAIDITTTGEETTQEERQILRGIINFGNTYVKQIMRSRLDVVAFEINTPLPEIVEKINEDRYSRVPVFNGTLDKIEGILYIKDLVPHLQDGPGFQWQSLIRQPYFVPEMKKIDALLQEFKSKKVHLAIVVDEYGGTAGIATMEDILEEIVGDINDEFDDEEIYYSRLDDENFVFDGKTALTDVVRVMNLDEETFEKIRGEAETIGGLVVEMSGRIPSTGEKLDYEDFSFTVELADRRRVRRVKVSRAKPESESEPV